MHDLQNFVMQNARMKLQISIARMVMSSVEVVGLQGTVGLLGIQ